jgi:hypothetical protein
LSFVTHHSCGRLIEEDDRRISDQGDGDGQLALVTARIRSRRSIGVLREAQSVEQEVDHFVQLIRLDTADATVELEGLARCQEIEDGVAGRRQREQATLR